MSAVCKWKRRRLLALVVAGTLLQSCLGNIENTVNILLSPAAFSTALRLPLLDQLGIATLLIRLAG